MAPVAGLTRRFCFAGFQASGRAVKASGPTAFRAPMATTSRLFRKCIVTVLLSTLGCHDLCELGSWYVESMRHLPCDQFSEELLRCVLLRCADFVKMDWCNTNINGTQLDPRVSSFPHAVWSLH